MVRCCRSCSKFPSRVNSDPSFFWIIAVCLRALIPPPPPSLQLNAIVLRLKQVLIELQIIQLQLGVFFKKKIRAGGKLGSGGDKMKLSQFKMDFFSVWLEGEAARLMLNACFYVSLETVLSAVQHRRLTASDVLSC